MTSNSALIAVKCDRWWSGFHNIFAKENHAWWGTSRWLVQMIIWMIIVNGLMAGTVLVNPQVGAAEAKLQEHQLNQGKPVTNPIPPLPQTMLTIFFTLSGIAPAIGVVILGQEALIGEKQSGTAAWILSKPLSRVALVLSKLSADAIGILATMVIVQGLVASQIYRLTVGEPLPLPGFITGLGLLYLVLMFYLALTYMLGALFHTRGPVIGIPLLLVFGNQIASLVPWFGKVMPWNLVMNLGSDQPSLAIALANGQPLPTVTPIIGTLILTLTFVLVALWRFQREEL